MGEKLILELRLGNYIIYDTKIGEVDSIHYDGVGVISNNSTRPLLQGKIEPIPLTEEWLLKFGFEFYCGDHQKRGVKIGEHEEWEGETTFKFSIDDVVSFESVEIKYVHQLQNLYFALTGEELTIKETAK